MNFQTSISDVINIRYDLRNYLLTTGGIRKSIQKKLKSVVTDGKLNDAIIILADPNPFQVTIKDIKKFDAQNPIIGKVLTQIETSKLSDKKSKNN